MTAFGLVLGRLMGLFLLLPTLSLESAPVRARLAVLLGLAFGLSSAVSVPDPEASFLVAFLAEVLVGAALGLMVRVVWAAVEGAGELIGLSMGFGFDRTVDPLGGESASTVSRIFEISAWAFVLVSGADREVLRGLAASYSAVPAGALTDPSMWSTALTSGANSLFASSLLISAPLVFTSLAVQLALGLLSRVAPELNVFSLGFTISVAVGIVALLLHAPALFVDLGQLVWSGSQAIGSALE
ncbi:MAG: flagellar biosynthetic protein FliR [Deltaproteobacteria bacterium]|nr:flagellar biosynthetic protein FliR [Deltaproteobacteria bacterium]